MVHVNLKRKVTTVKNNTNKPTEAPKKAGPKLQLKESFMKGYNFLMFLAPAIAAYIFVVNGNSTELKVLAGVLLVDAAVHVWKLVAVVK